MGSKEFIEKCKEIVMKYAKEHLDKIVKHYKIIKLY